MPTKLKSIIVIIFVVLMLAIQLFAGNDQEKSIQLPNGLTVKYIEKGDESATPIIFLHGYTDSWRSFENVVSLFPKKYHVIAISQRGHGNSDRPDTYRIADFAADLAFFITQKHLGACIIVGHSLGGLITQQFALDYPHLTKAIIIESSGASFADNAGVPEFLGEVMKLNDPIDRQFGEGFQTSTIARPIAPERLNLYIDETGKVPARVWKGIATELLQTNFSNELQKIKVPALILWGDKDSFVLKDDQDQLVQGLSSSRLIIYEGFGHALHWEDPARYVNDVSGFVKSVLK